MFFGMGMQIGGGSVSRDASAGWNFSRRCLPDSGRGRSIGIGFPVGCSPLPVAFCRRAREECHSYQKHTLRLVPAGRQGTAIRPGVHSNRASDRLLLGRHIRALTGRMGRWLRSGAVLEVPLSV